MNEKRRSNVKENASRRPFVSVITVVLNVASKPQDKLRQGNLRILFSGVTFKLAKLIRREVNREFLYVDDMADGCVFLMENIKAEDMKRISPDYFVNLGTGEDIKLKDLALLIKNIVGFEGGIKYDTSKPDGTPRKLLDVSRMKELGWKPTIDLSEGIKKTIQWLIT
jgi:nucleoside-diphosphate-sugar epimerase